MRHMLSFKGLRLSHFLELSLPSKTSRYYINNVLFSTVLLYFHLHVATNTVTFLAVVNKTTIRRKKKKEF